MFVIPSSCLQQRCSKTVCRLPRDPQRTPLLLALPIICRLLHPKLQCRLPTRLYFRGNLIQAIIAASADVLLEHAVEVKSQSSLLAPTFAP